MSTSTHSAFRVQWSLLAATIGLMLALSLTGGPRWDDVARTAGAVVDAVQAATASHAAVAPPPVWRAGRFAGA
jgi:hypothetical protein